MKFKVGDKVRCIDASKSMLGELKEGENYIILDVDKEGFVKLKGLSDYDYDPSRFKKEYTYENLKKSPIGTRVTFKDGTVLVKNGSRQFESPSSVKWIDDLKNLESKLLGKIIKIEEPEYTTVYEAKVEILDEVEKRYLRGVIRPFRDNVEIIRKLFSRAKGKYYIQIRYKDEPPTNLPYFESKKMYKNMEDNKKYTLEKLGL